MVVNIKWFDSEPVAIVNIHPIFEDYLTLFIQLTHSLAWNHIIIRKPNSEPTFTYENIQLLDHWTGFQRYYCLTLINSLYCITLIHCLRRINISYLKHTELSDLEVKNLLARPKVLNSTPGYEVVDVNCWGIP